jgi:hypothetical protein
MLLWEIVVGYFENCVKFVNTLCWKNLGRDSSDGIATRFRLDCSGIESQWGVRFSVPFQTYPGSHPASYTVGTGTFPGVKRPGVALTTHPHLALKFKKE